MEVRDTRSWRAAPRRLADADVADRRLGHLTAYAMTVSMASDVIDPADADVLIVDDDDALRGEMASYLKQQGYVLHEARDAREARHLLKSQPIQLIVLDVMLPGEDGLSLCRSLAGAGRGPAVLMLSSMGESIDRILGLELGADDYVVKPVSPRELLARVRALLRRRASAPSHGKGSVYSFAGFRFDLVRRQLRAPDGTVIMLTPGELSILGAFVENPQKVLPREELMRLSRGDTGEVLDRAIDIQISRLRRKLNSQSGLDEIIKTHRGLGYVLDARVARA